MIDWPLADLLPHAGDMILIDQVLAFDEEQIRTRLTVRDAWPRRRTACGERNH